ncbi:glycosyltransferase [Nocardia sp. JCM 34519.1]|uniref:glycosyltransferase n=1 Tax=Nocardia sp. JCM 34519.1 TaxID=2876119 RepID=UPI001CE3C9BD|nr:glycosyltransferase [Nocardia sp. JCM 34519.1]
MRVLCTVTGSQGHAREVLPLAAALARAEHDVLVVTAPELADTFRAAGLPVRAELPGIVESISALMRARKEAEQAEGIRLPEPSIRDQLLRTAAGPHVTAIYRMVFAIAADFRPDAVVRDGAELAGMLVAETLGIPHISAPSGAGNIIDPAGLTEPLAERRAELGLPPVDGPVVHRFGRFESVPHEYSFAEYDMPEPFAYRQPLQVGGGGVLPPEFAGLSGDRPLVLAAVGTALPMLGAFQSYGVDLPEQATPPEAIIRALIEGLSEVDCHAVVATAGFAVDGITAGPNVHLLDWVPQTTVLQCAQLFLTHAGYNSVREAIRTATPMVTLPQFGDQPHNADRIAHFGLGERLAELTAECVHKTTTAVLADDRIAAESRRAHRRMLALPPVDAAVEHLTELVASARN